MFDSAGEILSKEIIKNTSYAVMLSCTVFHALHGSLLFLLTGRIPKFWTIQINAMGSPFMLCCFL